MRRLNFFLTGAFFVLLVLGGCSHTKKTDAFNNSFCDSNPHLCVREAPTWDKRITNRLKSMIWGKRGNSAGSENWSYNRRDATNPHAH